jgi:predicted RNA binding protein YcfA (HicA-like mRNA interferase family)
MGKLTNLKPERVIKAFIRAGWEVESYKSTSHVKLSKEGYEKILSIPMHKKDMRIGLIKNEIKKSGMTEDEFLRLYK